MTTARRRVGLFFFINCLLLNGCAVGPNYKRPADPIPKAYLSSNNTIKTVASPTKFGNTQWFLSNEDVPIQWWKLFHSKRLNELVAASLKHNPSISAAEANLHAALETVYATRGIFSPSINASFSPTDQQTAKILTSVLANNNYIYSLYTGQLLVSYTPDVFGGNRRQLESLVAQAETQRLQLAATYLTLTTNVVTAAIKEAAVRAQILATKQMIASQARILSIYQQQLPLGDVSVDEITTQEAILAATEATLPPLEKQLAIQRNLLNALTGRFPHDHLTPEFSLSSLKLPPHLPISLPSALLEHRPDIRAAEQQLRAANALIGVAIANRLPNITIGSTNTGTTATSFSSLFTPSSTFWALAGIVTQPVFQGGTLLHKQRYAKAMYEQTAAIYRLTVINAFQNVADTLNAIKIDALALRAAYKAQRAALKNLAISRRKRILGESSKLSILNSEQIYHQAKLNMIQAQANRLSDTVALFQALGGGWS